MKRSGYWSRRRPMPRRAPVRNGVPASQGSALDDLARAIVMVRAGAAAFPNPDGSLAWQGPCEWHAFEGDSAPRWLQWSHIRGKAVAPRLRWHPLNAKALCSECHLGRWHDSGGWARRDPLAAARMDTRRTAFLNAIRTPEQQAWLMLKNERHEKPKPEAVAAELLATLRAMTHGRPELAMPTDSLAIVLALAEESAAG